MSLDVTLTTPADSADCPHCGRSSKPSTVVFDCNITHNLNEMADAAGIYRHLWRPDELGITKAGELVKPLRAGLDRLKACPAKFEMFNPSNRWGSYAGLVKFVEQYLEACEAHPDALVSVSR